MAGPMRRLPGGGTQVWMTAAAMGLSGLLCIRETKAESAPSIDVSQFNNKLLHTSNAKIPTLLYAALAPASVNCQSITGKRASSGVMAITTPNYRTITWSLFMKAVSSLVVILALVSGCAAQAPAPQQQVQTNLDKPIDCSTAAADIQTLNSEKARTSQEIEDGVSSIVPVGAVAHMFGGSEKDSLEIGTGEYNKKLDAKIAQIRLQCNVN
jgi:hypothetical protein